MQPIPVQQITKVAGKGFFWWLKFSTTLLLFIYIFVVAILLSIQANDPGVFIQEIGKQLFSPIQSAQELVKDFKTDTFTNSFSSYLGLILELYKIYIWLKIFMWISFKMSIDSAMTRFLFSTLIFYLIQCIYTAWFLHDISLPFVATKDIFVGIGDIIMKHEFSTSFRFESIVTNSSNDTCIDKICTA